MMQKGPAATTIPPVPKTRANTPPRAADGRPLLAIDERGAARGRMTAAEHARFLEVELDRTKRHLAEVIDEVVFAERCKVDSEAKLAAHKTETEAIENILQDLIGYIIALESSVIVPAIDDVAEAIPSGTVAERAQLFSDLEKLHHVTPRTIRLIASMRNPSETRRDRFRQRREQLMRHSERVPVSLDDAYALCAMLLDAKEELQLLLSESRDRAFARARDATGAPAMANLHHQSQQQQRAFASGLNNASGLSASQPSNNNNSQMMLQQQQQQQQDHATQQFIDELKRQVEAVRFELDASRKEKDMLNKRLNELSVSNSLPYEQLQQQHYQEKERLQLQVRTLQESEKSASEKYQYLNGKLEVLGETVQQLQEEKKLLQAEIKNYRRNETAIADGQQLATLQQQSRQSADEAQRLRLELDALVREHSSTVTRLEAQNSHLRLELAEAKQVGRPANNEYFAQLQRTNDLLRKDLVVLQQRLLSSTSHVTDSSAGFDAKVQAFEMTIDSLNTELAQLERRINQQEDAFAQERAALISEMDRERLKFQRDKEDYDVLMQRMVDEMEKIVGENKLLKERMQAIGRS